MTTKSFLEKDSTRKRSHNQEGRLHLALSNIKLFQNAWDFACREY